MVRFARCVAVLSLLSGGWHFVEVPLFEMQRVRVEAAVALTCGPTLPGGFREYASWPNHDLPPEVAEALGQPDPMVALTALWEARAAAAGFPL